jgi:hypothetical protein
VQAAADDLRRRFDRDARLRFEGIPTHLIVSPQIMPTPPPA